MPAGPTGRAVSGCGKTASSASTSSCSGSADGSSSTRTGPPGPWCSPPAPAALGTSEPGPVLQAITTSVSLRPIRLHDLKHTTATLLRDLGVPARDGMDILGHSRIAVTMEVSTGPMTPADARRSPSSTGYSEPIRCDRCCHFCCHSGWISGSGPWTWSVIWWAYWI